MFMTSALYFSVSIFGEKIETNEARGQEAGEISESQHNETNEASQNVIPESGNETQKQLAAEQGSQDAINNESTSSEATESPTQKALEVKETQIQNKTNSVQNIKEINKEGTEAHEASEAKGIHEESASEKQRKNLEHPLSLAAGGAYAAVGLWMILDKRNSKIPYIVAIVGSVVLLGIYAASRTSGIDSLGTEPVGILDIIVAMLQGGITAGSIIILLTKSNLIIE
jgi:hypothetical protein